MNRLRSGLAGLLAAGVALGTAELAAGLLPGGRSPVSSVADRVIEATPGPIVLFAIETFGEANRTVLLLSMALVAAVAGASLGMASRRRWRIGVIGFAAFGVLGAAATSTDALATTAGAVLAPAAGVVAGLVTLRHLLRAATFDGPVEAPATSPEVATSTPATRATVATGGGPASDSDTPRWLGSIDPTRPDAPPRSRREFLVGATAAAGAAASMGFVGRALQNRTLGDAAREATELPTPRTAVGAPPPGTLLDVPDISPLVTPTDDFYRIDTAFTVPRVDPDTHRIRVSGLVDHPFELTFDELLHLVDREEYVTLSCVSNEVGGGLVGNARWLGVPLADLLDRAGVQPEATQIVGRSVDGWTGGFPVEAAYDGRPALVAVGMNGEPLPAQHGFPVRLVISGLYGYVSDTKWLSEIELTTFEDYDAYWIPRGWARFGPIKTQSRIDVPESGATFGAGDVVLAGVAWSDEDGVSGVQISVDGGPWEDAEVADELASTSWRQWRHIWAATSGDHLVRVRAFDADGTPQTAQEAPPAPDGATGHHTVHISIV